MTMTGSRHVVSAARPSTSAADRRTSPFDDPEARLVAGVFGMWVFLVVLGVFFAAAMIAFVAVRIDLGASDLWSAPEAPPPPPILLLSTVVLAMTSLVLVRADRAVVVGGDPAPGLRGGLALGAVFLLLQGWAWIEWWRQGLEPTTDLYAWTFYVLTGVHGLHVVGGLVAIAWVLGRWSRPAPRPLRIGSVRFTGMYWHFLGLAWLGFYGLLWWAAP